MNIQDWEKTKELGLNISVCKISVSAVQEMPTHDTKETASADTTSSFPGIPGLNSTSEGKRCKSPFPKRSAPLGRATNSEPKVIGTASSPAETKEDVTSFVNWSFDKRLR